jgi:uncharacterized protein (DUF2147 family)
MRTLWYGGAAVAMIGFAATMAGAETAEDAFGTWLNPDNGSHVSVYKCGDGLCAKITKITDAQKTDDKNTNPDLRSRPIVGLVIMSGAKRTGDNQWKGQIYNRADGNTYAGTLTVKNRNALDLQGCAAVVFCKTVTWTRI